MTREDNEQLSRTATTSPKMTGYNTITSFHDYEETFVVVKQKNCVKISLNLYFKVYQCMKVVELVTRRLKNLKLFERSLKFGNISNMQY